MGNHPDISYKGGQQPIVHLQADFHKVINWANSNSVSWAFSNGNAGAYLTNFYNHPLNLTRLTGALFLLQIFVMLKSRKANKQSF